MRLRLLLQSTKQLLLLSSWGEYFAQVPLHLILQDDRTPLMFHRLTESTYVQINQWVGEHGTSFGSRFYQNRFIFVMPLTSNYICACNRMRKAQELINQQSQPHFSNIQMLFNTFDFFRFVPPNFFVPCFVFPETRTTIVKNNHQKPF